MRGDFKARKATVTHRVVAQVMHAHGGLVNHRLQGLEVKGLRNETHHQTREWWAGC